MRKAGTIASPGKPSGGKWDSKLRAAAKSTVSTLPF